MTTLVVEPTFLDTNILIYASIAEAPWHATALSAIQKWEQVGIELWISRQVLREYLAVLSRPQVFTSPISITTLIAEIRAFESRFQIAEDGPQITANLLKLLEQVSIGGKQVHDANIVATMQAYNLKHLLTHNTADFDRFANYVTVAPLEKSSA